MNHILFVNVIITQIFTPFVPIFNHPFDFVFVPKCKPLFKLLDVFIVFFLNIPIINTTNLSWNLKSQI